MTRQDLQQRLAALNHKINEELAHTELPRSVAYQGFPARNWGLVPLCLAWWLFGQNMPYVGVYHEMTGSYAFWGAGVLSAIALLRTLRWLFRPKPPTSSAYAESTRRIRELQDQRREIQRRIKELDEV